MVILRLLYILLHVARCAGLRVGQPHKHMVAGHNSVASIIAMDIRLPEEKSKFLSIETMNRYNLNDTDVFICTDREFYTLLHNFSNVVGARFAEDDPTPRGKYGGNTIQWWRLQQCWDHLRLHEISRGYNYTFIAKLRTDCFRFRCVPTYNAGQRFHSNYSSDIDKYAFIHSDYGFGGSHAVMEWISSLYQRIGTDYWARDDEYVPLNFDLIAKCDINAGRFEWLNWPREPFGDNCSLKPFSPKCQLKPFNVIQHLDSLRNWSKTFKVGDRIPTYTNKYFNNSGISSEKVFVLDLMAKGLIIRHWITKEGSILNKLKDDTLDGDIGIINYTFNFSNFNLSTE